MQVPPTILDAMGHERTAVAARPLRTALLVLTAAWLALFAPQLLAGRVFVLGDARVYRPFAEYSRERWLGQHERTFWNPYVMDGIAASASLADMRPQYLPGPALDVFERVRPGRFVPLAAPLIAHLAGMWAMAALAWAFGATSVVAIAWAGLAWGLSPLLLVPIAFGHTAYFVAASLVPAMLLAVHGITHARGRVGRLGAGLALAGLAGLQALTGHPQVVAYSGAAVLAFAVERAVRTRRWQAAATTGVALAWGAAIAMAVWLPALRYGDHSVRSGVGASLEQMRNFSIAWRELLAFAFPAIVGTAGDTYWGGLWTTDYPRFLGTTVVLFALAGLIGQREAGRLPRTFLGLLTLAGIGLALGPRLGAVFTVIHAVAPEFRQFRVVSMALVMIVPAMALLSAAGVDHVLAGIGQPAATRAARAAGIAAAALLVIALLLLTVGARGYAAIALALRPGFALGHALAAARAAGVDLALRALVLAAVSALLVAAPRLRWAPAGLLALLALDLAAVGLPTLRRATAPVAALTAAPEPALARFGREHPAARVLSTRVVDTSSWEISGLGTQPELRSNDWIRWRAHAFGGEHGTPASTWEEEPFLRSSEVIRALGVVYVSSAPDTPQDTSAFGEVERTSAEVVYRLHDALGRAYAVGRVRALPADAEVVPAMLADGFRADSVAYTFEADAAGEYPGSASARIQWLEDEPDDLALHVEAAAPAFVVVADAWFAGWDAWLDGAPVQVSRVDHSLRGIAVPAGRHELRMRYRPEGWEGGVRVTRAALSLWLVSALAWLALRRTSHQSPSRAASSSSLPSRAPNTESGLAPRRRK
jgi:hypothetical protein